MSQAQKTRKFNQKKLHFRYSSNSPLKGEKLPAPASQQVISPYNAYSPSFQLSQFTHPTAVFGSPKLSHLKNVKVQLKEGAYEGQMMKEHRWGEGRMAYKDGRTYEGKWKGDKRYGQGVLKDKKGSIVYKGYWLDDLYHGRGVQINTKRAKEEISFTDLDFT